MPPSNSSEECPEKLLTFHVRLSSPSEGVYVGVCGSSARLGSWDARRGVLLEESNGVWSTTLSHLLPFVEESEGITTLEYRYFTYRKCSGSAASANRLSYVIEQWEAMKLPRQRILPPYSVTDESIEEFGKHPKTGESYPLQRGWLVDHSEVHLSFCNAVQGDQRNYPVHLYSHTSSSEELYIRCYSHHSQRGSAQSCCSCDLPVKTCVSNTSYNSVHSSPTQISSTCMTFKTTTCALQNQIISLQVLNGTERILGTATICPALLSTDSGFISLTLTGPDLLPAGELTVTYLVIRALQEGSQDWSMKEGYCFTRDDVPENSCLFIGHRGSGTSRHLPLSHSASADNLHENTLAGIKLLADRNVKFVEVDVVLTKDRVPVVHHDFSTCLSIKRLDGKQMFTRIPIHMLTYDQLVSFRTEYDSSDGLEDHDFVLVNGKTPNERRSLLTQPFPTLEELLLCIDPVVKVLLELKYPQETETGTIEDEIKDYFTRNDYVDSVMGCLHKFAGNRDIILGSFDADTLTCAVRKQNRYPGMFIHMGKTSVYELYKDPRTQTVAAGVDYCKAEELLGIHGNSEDYLFGDSVESIRDSGLTCFCWGDRFLNTWDSFDTLERKGVQGFVVDSVMKHVREGRVKDGLLRRRLTLEAQGSLEHNTGEGLRLYPLC